jgi:hypothetical protein
MGMFLNRLLIDKYDIENPQFLSVEFYLMSVIEKNSSDTLQIRLVNENNIDDLNILIEIADGDDHDILQLEEPLEPEIYEYKVKFDGVKIPGFAGFNDVMADIDAKLKKTH